MCLTHDLMYFPMGGHRSSAPHPGVAAPGGAVGLGAPNNRMPWAQPQASPSVAGGRSFRVVCTHPHPRPHPHRHPQHTAAGPVGVESFCRKDKKLAEEREREAKAQKREEERRKRQEGRKGGGKVCATRPACVLRACDGICSSPRPFVTADPEDLLLEVVSPPHVCTCSRSIIVWAGLRKKGFARRAARARAMAKPGPAPWRAQGHSSPEWACHRGGPQSIHKYGDRGG